MDGPKDDIACSSVFLNGPECGVRGAVGRSELHRNHLEHIVLCDISYF